MIGQLARGAVIVGISCGLHACTSSAVKRPLAEPGVPFTLAIGQTVPIAETDLTLTLVDVLSDSRCAVDVQCVWEGEATIRLRAKRGQDEKTLELSTRGEASSAVDGGLRISFEELSPATHSKKTISKSEYRATIRVAPVGRETG